MSVRTIQITAGEVSATATLDDSRTAEAILRLLEEQKPPHKPPKPPKNSHPDHPG